MVLIRLVREILGRKLVQSFIVDSGLLDDGTEAEPIQVAGVLLRLEDARIPPTSRSAGPADHENERPHGTGARRQYLSSGEDVGLLHEGVASKFDGD